MKCLLKRNNIRMTYKLLGELLRLPDGVEVIGLIDDPQHEVVRVRLSGTNSILDDYYEGMEVRELDIFFSEEELRNETMIPEKVILLDEPPKAE